MVLADISPGNDDYEEDSSDISIDKDYDWFSHSSIYSTEQIEAMFPWIENQKRLADDVDIMSSFSIC